MRPPVFAALAVGLVLSPTASASPVHSVTATYLASGVDSVAGVTPAMYADVSGQGSEVQAVTVTPWADDRAVTVTLADRLGRPVLAAVVQHLGQDTFNDVELGRVCTGTAGRFRLATPSRPVTVYLLAGSCPTGASLPTTGTVTVRFTQR